MADAADIQRATVDLQCRQLDSPQQRASSCFRLDDSATANFSLNEHVALACQFTNGHCVVGVNADNNRISAVAHRASGGTGLAFYGYAQGAAGRGFRDSTFAQFSGNAPSYMEGMGDPGVTAPARNGIQHLDMDNSTPVPTAGPGSVWFGDFKQTYTPVRTCGGMAMAGPMSNLIYVRTATEVSVYFDVSVPKACGGPALSLPTKANANSPSASMALERSGTRNIYGVLIAPGAAALQFPSIAGGPTVSLSRGWVLTGQVRYLTAF